MRILLTNDDGYQSEGIIAFKKALAESGHAVWVLAPDENMSACSQSITTHRPLRVRQLDDENCFSCSGTPADCVILALRGALGTVFDCVVSGINIGPNLGDDITFSGTVAAARQSVLMGTPAVAFSLFDEMHGAPYLFDVISSQISKRLPQLVALSDSDHLVNVNIPNINREMSWISAHPSLRLYDDIFSVCSPPNSQDRFFFMAAEPRKITPERQSDLATVQNGNVSVSMINIHPIARATSDDIDSISDLNSEG